MKPTTPLALATLLTASTLLSFAQDKPTTSPTTAEVAGGDWKSADNTLTQSNSDTPALLLFGDQAWKDYTLEVEAKKTGGDEGFLIAVRAKDADHLVWLNVGGWGNTRTAFELLSDEGKSDFAEKQTYAPFVEVQNDKWHKLKVTVSGTTLEGFLDGKSACKATAEPAPAPQILPTGKVALGSWSTQTQFRNLKITTPDGKTLSQSLPTLPK